jgi:hypothetical protein
LQAKHGLNGKERRRGSITNLLGIKKMERRRIKKRDERLEEL